MDAFFVVVLTLVLLGVGLGAVLAMRPVLAVARRPDVERPRDTADEPTVLLPRREDEDR